MEYFSDTHFDNSSIKIPLEVAEYENCEFRNGDLSGSDLSGCRFIDCRFIDCNLSNAVLVETSFQGVRFGTCKMLGLQWNDCKTFNFSIKLHDCNLSNSVFYQMKLTKCSFHNCQLQEADFTEADMQGVLMTKCNLDLATFDRTILIKADLRESTNYAIDPERNSLMGAKFSLPEVISLLAKYGLVID